MEGNPSLPSRSKEDDPTPKDDDDQTPKDVGPLPLFIRQSKTQILFEFDMERENLPQEEAESVYFLPDPYPPSSRPLKSLSSININDLKLNTRSSGCVIYLKTIETAFREGAIHTVVQDEEGIVERLAIYNVDFLFRADEFLPEDALLRIREPMLVRGESCIYIRVDHPCDLTVLMGVDGMIPKNLGSKLLEEKRTALEWKTIGNNAYSNGRFLEAFAAYSQGLEVCTEDDKDLRSVILRNRGKANISLGYFNVGLGDCISAVMTPTESNSEEIKAANTKSYQNAAHAAYSLRDYEQAEHLCKQVLELSPGSKEALQIMRNIEKRRQEQVKGDYDFERMAKLCTSKRPRLDCANYLSNIEIRDAGKHGRGLFTTKTISAGELIMCEKALFMAFDSDPVPMNHAILDAKEKRQLRAASPSLLYSICTRLEHDFDKASKVFRLYDGRTADVEPDVVDGRVVVDAFKAMSILHFNTLGVPSIASYLQASAKTIYPKHSQSVGIWEKMSYINHACNGNAARSNIGDMMILRATRDIKKDEEIFMPYRFPNADNAVTQEAIHEIWRFSCDCELCEAESHATEAQRKRRKDVSKRMDDLRRNEQKQSRAEALYKITKASYDEKTFGNLPRIGLVDLGFQLCLIYWSAGSWNKLVTAAVNILQDLGYDVQMDDRIVKVDRRHCLTTNHGHNAALLAAVGYKQQKKPQLAAEFEKLAESLWTIMYGTIVGLEGKREEISRIPTSS